MNCRIIACALSLGLVTGAFADQAYGGPKTSQKTQAAKAKKPTSVSLGLPGLRFGLTHTAIAKLYDKVFTKQYVPKMQKIGVGPRQAELEAELEEQKQQLRKTRVFGDLPSGLDATPIRYEYTYRNNESMTRAWLHGKVGTGDSRRSIKWRRHFFFFSDQMWKIYDEFHTGSKGPFATFKDAVEHYSGAFGAKPKHVAANPKERRDYDMAVWTVGDTIVQVLNREDEKRVAVLYLDKKVADNISHYRRNAPEDPGALDDDVADVTRGKH